MTLDSFSYFASGLLSNGESEEKKEQCCGNYPSRFPFTTGSLTIIYNIRIIILFQGQGRACCNNKTYSYHHMECCSDNELRPIGSC